MDIGFVGLGNMGGPMAVNMAKNGHKLTVHDLRKESAIELLEMGAEWSDTPKGVVGKNEVVFTSLPVPRDVETVVLGENGIVEGTSGDNIYVDLSTNSPTTIRRIHDECALKGIKVLDAPVSGATYGAAAGTLAGRVGGDEEIFKQIKPALDAIGSHVVYCGPIGNGMVTKICNNLLSMGIGVLMSEALTLGVKAGMDLEVLADVITNSTGGNKRLADKFPRFLFQGNFEPGFATALAAKDVRLATDLGREYGIPMELSNLVDLRHVEALFKGWGHEDSDAVAKLQEEKSGIQLRTKK